MNKSRTLSKQILKFACGAFGAFALAAVAHAVDSGINSDSDAEFAPGTVILFEGKLTRMDSALAPTLREGQVLSGFFTVDLESAPDDEDPTDQGSIFREVLVDGEFVFDVNHVVAALGSWRGDTDAWLTLNRGDGSEERPADIYAVTLPMEGTPFGEEAWRPLWFQIWLMGTPGKFLPNLRPQLPPEKVATGWYRAEYVDASGEQKATAEGPITFVGPEGGELSATEQIAQLEAVVRELSTRLETAERQNAEAQARLASAEQRIRGLNQTIDLLIQERATLQEELERMRETRAEPDKTLTARVAELEAQQAVLEETRAALATINEELAKSLASREADLQASRQVIARLEAEKAAPPGVTVLQNPIPDSPHPFLPPGQMVKGVEKTQSQPIGPPVIAAPVVPPEKPAEPVVVTEDFSPPSLEESPEPDESEPTAISVRRPRKFRR